MEEKERQREKEKDDSETVEINKLFVLCQKQSSKCKIGGALNVFRLSRKVNRHILPIETTGDFYKIY